ncbi:MAG TPA: CrcB family protein [Actinocrinis sp.]|jgi:CrcB protein
MTGETEAVSAKTGSAQREAALPIDPDVEPVPAGRARRGRPELPDPRLIGVIALGGAVGGLARYLIGRAAPTAHGGFPVATFGINVSGSFLLCLLVVLILEVWPPTTLVRPLLGVGFCGAYTTFSTWMVDTDRLIADRHYGTAALYLFGSLAAGLAAGSLGFTAGRAIVAHRHARSLHRSGEREGESAAEGSTS